MALGRQRKFHAPSLPHKLLPPFIDLVSLLFIAWIITIFNTLVWSSYTHVTVLSNMTPQPLALSVDQVTTWSGNFVTLSNLFLVHF